jgi:hypothetical protein
VNRVNPKRSLSHNHRFAVRSVSSLQLIHSPSVLTPAKVRGEELSLLRDATHVVCDSTSTLNPVAAMFDNLRPFFCKLRPHRMYMYPAVTFWWLKACCDKRHLFHPCEAALFKPRPNVDGCPDFKGKVVAFAGLSKAPATFEQYLKETVLVLGCSWSGEMHKGVHVLINCCPPLQDNDKITWT